MPAPLAAEAGRLGVTPDAVALAAPGGACWTYRELDPDVFGEELLGGAYVKCDRIAAVVLEVTRPAS